MCGRTQCRLSFIAQFRAKILCLSCVERFALSLEIRMKRPNKSLKQYTKQYLSIAGKYEVQCLLSNGCCPSNAFICRQYLQKFSSCLRITSADDSNMLSKSTTFGIQSINIPSVFHVAFGVIVLFLASYSSSRRDRFSMQKEKCTDAGMCDGIALVNPSAP